MAAGDPPAPGLRIRIQGTVQGVGMRPFVYRVARAEGLVGSVQNDARGVTIDAFGPPAALERFLARLRAEAPAAARLDEVHTEPLAGLAPGGFAIAGSDAAGLRRVSIPPDLAPCPDCLRELADPSDRRHRYPFTNCTACGPRFTIARDVPYDRAATTMAPFPLCADCAREYGDPSDRRFHAEPNACPRCGPRAWLTGPEGGERRAPFDGEAVAAAAALLREGRILALRGIGGFHLACDATSSAAVRALRERKRREEKPLAVMVLDLAAAGALAVVSPEEGALLCGPERPIVLLRRRPDAALAPEVAPDTPLLGLLLPCSPLHHLLLADAGRPLVMTSGNLSEEPIARGNAEALERLAGIADHFLLHDREIETRADDSVARVVGGRTLLLRRSRGYVPGPLRLPRPVARPVLACGALLKNAFCLASGGEAFLGPHIGDLENLATMESFEGAVARMERFLRLRPEALAHDLHPEMLSTRYALDRARAEGLPAVAVQHHHAHVVAAMAERGLEGPVLGLAWDGTGLGTDGRPWGGELLRCTAGGFERLATLRPLRLAGGDLAVRQPWRLALALLADALGPELAGLSLSRLPLFRSVLPGEVEVVRRMLSAGVNAPPAHGAGRWFDAVGALVLGRPRSRYEGQVAVALDAAADDGPAEPYPWEVDRSAPVPELDLRPMARAAVADLLEGAAAGRIAARFHATLAEGAAGLLARCAGEGRLPVVLTGGVFQNARLSQAVAARLAGRHEVHGHSLVPAGDGGLALGQALVADAILRG
ncbi:MAG: carbamoyltransferase HypF [Deltaproteobacteria bacterium]|nr:carbamoyltransferase HypF [Deltaproteobacteria bacterium]